MDRKPKFFCEYCGSEVKQNDKLCSHCGRFFASVKCPACGYTGESRIFRAGCPVCGYAFSKENKDSAAPGVRRRNGATDPLPWWIYLVSFLFLAAMVAFILVRR